MVIGWIRPAILVPVAALSGLTAPEMEAILAHELAHIRRHDYLVNVLQCLVETLVFYHPATWWISQVIRREREHCCDDIAVAACCDRIAYARALATMEGLRAPAFSLSPAANGGILLARVRRILEPQEESMSPISIPVRLAAILAVAPTWLLALGLGGHTTKADPGSVFPSIPPLVAFPVISTMSAGPDFKERTEPFPNVTFEELIASAKESPSVGFIVGTGAPPAPTTKDGGSAKQPTSETSQAIDQVRRVMKTFPDAQAGSARADGPTKPLAHAQPVVIPDGNVPVISDTTGSTDNPPSEVEVWAKVPKGSQGNPPIHEVQRNNIRIVMEKILDKAEPVKVYPLAGPCQLVHKHYKCTVYFDEVYTSDYPIPFNHVAHKVEVVYIDKDFLRRGPNPSQPAKGPEDPLDRIFREIEELKRKRTSDRQEQRRIIDRLIKELEVLKKNTLDAIHDGEAEKIFHSGMYYNRASKTASADFYFDKILERWPDSPWAIKVREQRVQAEPKPADRSAPSTRYFNFLVSGFY